MSLGTLTVVGSGIKFFSHLTAETKAHIQQTKKVLYSVNDPIMEEWIQQNNKNSESLNELYNPNFDRQENYKLETKYILQILKEQRAVCVVYYGHPSVFAKPALNAALKAKDLGYDVKILPGISAEDCLFADLMIDPGSCGCLSYEATDFLIHQRRFSCESHLILWQVGIIGATGIPIDFDNSIGAKVLQAHLSAKYPLTHEIILYEAAQYPTFNPIITKLPLSELNNAKFTSLSTLYIPPSSKSVIDPTMLKRLLIKR